MLIVIPYKLKSFPAADLIDTTHAEIYNRHGEEFIVFGKLNPPQMQSNKERQI